MTTGTDRKQRTHDHILDTAAHVLRKDGYAGVGVADIMKRAGLTHGGFYAHFASRDALLAEALGHAGKDSGARVHRALMEGEERGVTPFRALVDHYLSDRHLASPEEGCPVAALACETPRQSAAVRRAAAARTEALVAAVKATLPNIASEETATVIASQLVGAMQVARTLPAVAARRHIAASRQFLLDQFDSPRPKRR
jgi:TetR/AcrR family transcriptional repressor of nem operon